MSAGYPNGHTSADVTTTNPIPPRFPHPQKPPPTIEIVGLESKLKAPFQQIEDLDVVSIVGVGDSSPICSDASQSQERTFLTIEQE